MPDLQTNNWLVILGNSSKVYGNEFLSDYFPRVQATSVAWHLENVPSQQFLQSLSYTPSSAVNQGSGAVAIQWIDTDDPFTKFDLIDNEDRRVQDLIFLIRTSLAIPYREILSTRLITLFCYAKEEDPDSVGIDTGSLLNFYNFLRLNTDLKRPSITLTSDYTIYASWETEHKQVFDVLFLPGKDMDVRFAIFKPNDRHPEKEFRFSGTVTSDVLRETVAPHGVLDWILE